jgi:hypothetical protein
MKQVFVVKDGTTVNQSIGDAIASMSDIGNLAVGAVTLMVTTASGTIIPFTELAANDGLPVKMQLFQTMKSGATPKASAVFFPNQYTYGFGQYRAGVPQETFFGANGASGAVAVGTKTVGAEYGIEIIDLERPVWENRTYRITKPIITGSETTAQILDKLVAGINADSKLSKILTASNVANTAIKLVAKSGEEKFSVRPLGILYGTTITSDGTGNSVAPIFEIGSYEQVSEEERTGSMVEGKNDTRGIEPGIWKQATFTTEGVEYSGVTLTIKHDNQRSGYGVPSDNLSESEISIYFNNDDVADFQTLLTFLSKMSNVTATTYATSAADLEALAGRLDVLEGAAGGGE